MECPILSLNADILHLILDQVELKDLLATGKTCQKLHISAQVFIDANIDLLLTDRFEEANGFLLERFSWDTALLSRIRHITVSECYPPNAQMEPALPLQSFPEADPWSDNGYFSRNRAQVLSTRPTSVCLLADALRSVQLMSFTWSAVPQLPLQVAAALQHQSDCRVAIRQNTRAYALCCRTFSPMLNWSALEALNRISESLVELDLIVPPEDDILLSELGRLIASCSALRILKLRNIGWRWGTRHKRGISERSDQEYDLRGFSTAALYPNMNWLSKPVQQSGRLLSIEEFDLDRFCVCDEPSFSLEQLCHVSQLKTLKFGCFGFVARSSPALEPRSVHLDLWSLDEPGDGGRICLRDWQAHTIREKICEWQTLRHLHLLGQAKVRSIINECLFASIGSRLTSLTIRRFGTASLPADHHSETNESTDIEILEGVGQYCPQLEYLSINTWGAEFLDNIRQFFDTLKTNTAHVERLDLYLENHAIPICQEEAGAFARAFNVLGTVSNESSWEKPTMLNVHRAWNNLRAPTSVLQRLSMHINLPANSAIEDYGRLFDPEYIFEGRLRMTMTVHGDAKIQNASPDQLQITCPQWNEALDGVKQQWWDPKDNFWETRANKLRKQMKGDKRLVQLTVDV